jgi:hypothetical protein
MSCHVAEHRHARRFPMTEAPAVMSGELTDKQLSYVEYYVGSHNATQAAIKAGYSRDTAYSSGQRLLKNVEVAAAIAEREADIANQLGLTKQRILEALWDAYQRAVAMPDGKQLSVAVKCLELLMRHRSMLRDRHHVEMSANVVYTLDLGAELDAELGDGPGELPM